MIKKIKIADAQTDLPSLVKSVTEDKLSIPDLRESLQLSLQQINENETYSLEEVLGDID